MVGLINYWPCKPGVAGSIPAFTSLIDEQWPHLHIIIAVGRRLNRTDVNVQRQWVPCSFL